MKLDKLIKIINRNVDIYYLKYINIHKYIMSVDIDIYKIKHYCFDEDISEHNYLDNSDIEYSEENQKILLKYFASNCYSLDYVLECQDKNIVIQSFEKKFIECAEKNKIDLSFEDNFLMKSAVYCDRYLIVKYLLENDVSADCCDNYPIKYICSRSYGGDASKILKLLIEKGADVNADYYYPIKCSIYRNQFNFVKILIDNNVDIYFDNNIILKYLTHPDLSKFGHNYLRPEKIKKNYYDTLLLLIDHNLNDNSEFERIFRESVINDNEFVVQYFIERGIDLNCLTKKNILNAINNHAYLVIEILIKNGFDLNFLNDIDVDAKDESIYNTFSILYNNGINPDIIIKLINPGCSFNDWTEKCLKKI